jgi:glutathione S-transferase
MDGSVRLGWPWFGDEEISTLVWIRKLLDFWQASSLHASFNFIYLFKKKKKEREKRKEEEEEEEEKQLHRSYANSMKDARW